MADNESVPGQFERWVRSSATVVAPATVLSALLFYFGYVSARARYGYFGIDVDTIGLSTQDYIMRSPQGLLVPLLVLTLAGAGVLTLRSATHRRVTDAAGDTSAYTARIVRIRLLARVVRCVGAGVLGVGVAMLFVYGVILDWAFYALVTPLVLALGASLIVYGSSVLALLQRLLASEAPDGGRRAWRVLIYVLIAASIFWTTSTVAGWSGLGAAREQAKVLDRLPNVILDTKERLFLRNQNVDETVLAPESAGQTFHYRYRRLRLLIHNQDRMFLVPDQWSASNSTLVVTLDGSVRVQFQFQNQRP